MLLKNIYIAYKELGGSALLKTLRFNIHYFGFKRGLQLPVFIYESVYFKQRLGSVKLSSFKIGNVKIGKNIVGVFEKMPTVIQFNDGCNIEFGDGVIIGSGCKVSASGGVKLGDNVCITGKSMIIANQSVTIQENSLISWNVQIMDTDLHKLYVDEKYVNGNKSVIVGKNVWVNSHCTILKGTVIADNCVVGANSLINSQFEKQNCLIVGNPAKVVRENIIWKR